MMDLFAGRLGVIPPEIEFNEIVTKTRVLDDRTDGAVLVISGQWHTGDYAAYIKDRISKWPWALVVITSDEEGLFPVPEHQVPRQQWWVQHPIIGRRLSAKFFPTGYPVTLRDQLQKIDAVPVQDRKYRYCYIGQHNNLEREECCHVLARIPDGILRMTTKYVWTYRFFEACLCGCVPVVETPLDIYRGFIFDVGRVSTEWSVDAASTNFATASKILALSQLDQDAVNSADDSASIKNNP